MLSENLKEIEILKENDKQKIILVSDNSNNKYIKREIYDDKRRIYKTIQQINHPNIPKIYGIEFDESTVVIEEYIEGNTLAELIDGNVPLSKRQINSIAKQLAAAVEAIHSKGIIHRDIKPDNIIINKSGHLWLIDYNISRFYRDEARQDTEVMGTFGYAPIEQFGMMPTDYKTDIYSYGITITELLNNYGIKGSLYKIASKCKRLDPSQRYKNSHKLNTALRYRWLRNPLIYVVVLLAILFTCAAVYKYIFPYGIEGNDKLNFIGFEQSELEIEYENSSSLPYTVVFSVNEPWDHLLFIEDIRKKGRIRLNNSNIKADIELSNGVLSVKLKDSRGHSFDEIFEYNPKYTYEKRNTEYLRKNADIICRDMDDDGEQELLIGVDEVMFLPYEKQIINYFNYCQGWCVKYDKDKGFTLCDGDMFVRYSYFWLNDANSHFNMLNWEENDCYGYYLEDDKIKEIPFTNIRNNIT